jgi:hypothetical protein
MKCNRRRFAFASAGLLAAGLGSRVSTVGAQQPGQYFVYGDTVEGGKNRPEDSDRHCVLSNIFPRNAQIVWRMRVVDMKQNGLPVDDTVIKSVDVTLADGTVVTLKYGGHPPDENTDFFWSAGWVVPKDYPTGTLLYTVTATAMDGQTATYAPFDISASLLTVTEEVLPDLSTEEPATEATPAT